MEKLIKKILKEYQSSLDELMPTFHYEKQIGVRFKGDIKYTVRKFTKNKMGRLEIRDIGTYELSKRQKSTAEGNITEVMSVDVPENLNIGIAVYKVDIDISQIDYFTKDDKYETFREYTSDDTSSKLYLMDPETESVGDVLFFIIKENKVITTFWERSYNLNSVKEKRNLDVVITADQIRDYAV